MSVKMIVFPNCKINLGLRITRKRPDGFHDLQTIFYPVPLTDALEIIQMPGPTGADITLSLSGITVDGEPEANLCVKAYRLLKRDFSDLPPVQLHLHKAIPLGAGLGGGSADGTFTLQLLNDKFKLGLSQEQLITYALQLGSDCPFFVINQPCIASGRGELLTPINISLSGYQLVLVNPGIHINTGWAFRQLNRAETAADDTAPGINALAAIEKKPVHDWKHQLFNDFETPVFDAFPAIAAIKNQLYQTGALYAAMSGTGSSVFAIFEKDKLLLPSFPENYLVRNILL